MLIWLIGRMKPSVRSSPLVNRSARPAWRSLAENCPVTISCRNPSSADRLEVGVSPNVNDFEHGGHSSSEEPLSHKCNHCSRPMSTKCVSSRTHLAGTLGTKEMLHCSSKSIVSGSLVREKKNNLVHVCG